MSRTLIALGVALMIALVTTPRAGRAETNAALQCSVPDELIQDDPLLPNTAMRLKTKEPLTIVAIGGSSTVGDAAGGGDAAYPHQLELALNERYAGVPITVVNKGLPRQAAHQMADRFEHDVLPAKPALVVWEVGITDAVREIDLDEFAATLEDGITWLRAHDIEVMLMDMQFSPDTTTVINFQPYLDALHQRGSLSEIYVFRRYDIMKYWSDAGMFQFTDVPKEERRTLAVKVYACLGQRLADAIAYAAR